MSFNDMVFYLYILPVCFMAGAAAVDLIHDGKLGLKDLLDIFCPFLNLMIAVSMILALVQQVISKLVKL